jgi:hypothetical protein
VRNGRHPIHRHNTDSHPIIHHRKDLVTHRQIGIRAEIGIGIVGVTVIIGAVVRTTVAIARRNAVGAAADSNIFYRLT